MPRPRARAAPPPFLGVIAARPRARTQHPLLSRVTKSDVKRLIRKLTAVDVILSWHQKLNEKSQTQLANLAAANDDGAPKSQDIYLIQPWLDSIDVIWHAMSKAESVGLYVATSRGRPVGRVLVSCRAAVHVSFSMEVDLLGKAYSDWGHISDAVAVFENLIIEHPEYFCGYLAKVLINLVFYIRAVVKPFLDEAIH